MSGCVTEVSIASRAAFDVFKTYDRVILKNMAKRNVSESEQDSKRTKVEEPSRLVFFDPAFEVEITKINAILVLIEEQKIELAASKPLNELKMVLDGVESVLTIHQTTIDLRFWEHFSLDLFGGSQKLYTYVELNALLLMISSTKHSEILACIKKMAEDRFVELGATIQTIRDFEELWSNLPTNHNSPNPSTVCWKWKKPYVPLSPRDLPLWREWMKTAIAVVKYSHELAWLDNKS